VGYFFILFIYGTGVEPGSLLLLPFIDIFHQLLMIDGDDYGAISEMNEWQGKPKYSQKTCPSAALRAKS
jgi:hypothetical protein